MKRVGIISILGIVVWIGGCDLLRTTSEDTAVEEAAETPQEAVVEHLRAIEETRQREMPESMSVLQGNPEELERESVPEPVRQEWRDLAPLLFGDDSLELSADDGRWAQRVGYDAANQRLLFGADLREDEETMFAISMVANAVLEDEALGALPEVESVDGWLSREIIRRSGPAFVSSVVQAEQLGVALDVDDLADRPELAVHLPGLGDRLVAIERDAELVGHTEAPEGTAFFDAALQQMILRKSLALGSTLYRTGGWPAVEWGRSEPPMKTQHVVRPQRWFDGDGPAQWEWPAEFEQQRQQEGWEEVRRGEVGPALTSVWLEGLVGARAARTIFGAWMADSYRIYTRSDGEEEQIAFNWLTTWETPHDAQEIGSAMGAVLGHYLGHEHQERRFRVAVQGVNVAVSVYTTDQQTEEINDEVELLTQARTGYLPADGAPFEFAPTLYDRYVEQADESTLDLDAEKWTDAAAGWRVDIASLDGWTVQRSNEAHVRWFANHRDGTLIQWTTELIDPMEPEFGSDVYLQGLSEAFAGSVSAQEEPTVNIIADPVDPMVEMEVVGLIEGRPLVLHLWQWKRGDVLVSFSVQGPEQFFGDRFGEAQSVLSSLEYHGDAVEQRITEVQSDPGDDEGIIEFRVDDEQVDGEQ